MTDTCSICLDTFSEDVQECKLSCEHRFHTNCIVNSLQKSSNKCPLCRDTAGTQPTCSTFDYFNTPMVDIAPFNPVQWRMTRVARERLRKKVIRNTPRLKQMNKNLSNYEIKVIASRKARKESMKVLTETIEFKQSQIDKKKYWKLFRRHNHMRHKLIQSANEIIAQMPPPEPVFLRRSERNSRNMYHTPHNPIFPNRRFRRAQN